MTRFLRFLFLLPLLTAVSEARSEATVGHQIDLLIDPGRGTLAATDTMTLPPERSDWTFYLHQGLDPRVTQGDAVVTPNGKEGHLERYRLKVRGPGPVTLRYGGSIRHELEAVREGMGRSRQQSRGTIAEDGVVLDGYSGWYPRIPETLQTFRLNVQLPSDWSAVSQGTGPEVSSTPDGVRIGWREERPQDDIYLIAAPFERYVHPPRAVRPRSICASPTRPSPSAT